MEKRCSKCGETKDLSMFYKDANPRNRTGRQSRCKECSIAGAAEYARNHKEWASEQRRKYRQRHPETVRRIDIEKRLKKPELYRALSAKNQRIYRKRHPGIGLKGNAERLRRWRKLHPEREASTQAARRVLFKAIPAWGDKALIEVVYAKAKVYGFEVDHIVPLKHQLVCGLHVWANLQLLDRNLNRTKKNRIWPDMP